MKSLSGAMITQGARPTDLFQIITLGIQNKEVSEMLLSLEAIGVLGILYCLFMYGTLRALHTKKTVRPKAKPVAIDMARDTAKQAA
jgi:hypothetical protein